MNLFQSEERNAHNKASKTAIIFDEHDHTYTKFNEEVNRIAHALINYGVKRAIRSGS